MITDRSIFMVWLAHQAGPYSPERDVCDMDRKSTLNALVSGEWHGVAKIFEFNPAEGWSRDVTEDMAREVSDIWAQTGEELADWQYEFIEALLSVRAAVAAKGRKSYLRAIGA